MKPTDSQSPTLENKINMWREYIIRASFGQVQTFLAPDLMFAFALARSVWPTATHWECLGGKAV